MELGSSDSDDFGSPWLPRIYAVISSRWAVIAVGCAYRQCRTTRPVPFSHPKKWMTRGRAPFSKVTEASSGFASMTTTTRKGLRHAARLN